MRLAIILKSLTEYMPVDYRRVFVSILKNAFSSVGEDVYNELYGRPKVKPFTFSVYLPGAKFEENRIWIGKDRLITLNFSTCFTNIGAMFYNGMIKNKENGFKYKGSDDGVYFQLVSVILRTERKIESDKVWFKTLSPLVVRKHIGGEKQKDEYLVLNRDNLKMFEKQLNINMEPVFSEFMNKVYPLKISIVNDKAIKTIPVKIANDEGKIGYIKANLGKFILSGNPDALNFVYKVGLGARRSYGFGMLEVVKEDE